MCEKMTDEQKINHFTHNAKVHAISALIESAEKNLACEKGQIQVHHIEHDGRREQFARDMGDLFEQKLHYHMSTITNPTEHEFFKPWHAQLSQAMKERTTQVLHQKVTFNFKHFENAAMEEIQTINELMRERL